MSDPPKSFVPSRPKVEVEIAKFHAVMVLAAAWANIQADDSIVQISPLVNRFVGYCQVLARCMHSQGERSLNVISLARSFIFAVERAQGGNMTKDQEKERLARLLQKAGVLLHQLEEDERALATVAREINILTGEGIASATQEAFDRQTEAAASQASADGCTIVLDIFTALFGAGAVVLPVIFVPLAIASQTGAQMSRGASLNAGMLQISALDAQKLLAELGQDVAELASAISTFRTQMHSLSLDLESARRDSSVGLRQMTHDGLDEVKEAWEEIKAAETVRGKLLRDCRAQGPDFW